MTTFNKWQFSARSLELGIGTLFVTTHLVGQYQGKTSFRFFPEDRSQGALYLKARLLDDDADDAGSCPFGVELSSMGLVEVGDPKELRSTHPISNMSHIIAIKPADKWVYKGGNLKVPVRCPYDSNKWTMVLPLPQWYGWFPFEIFRDKYHGCSFHDCIESYYRCDHGRKAYKANVKV
jgi:hypothetical protein